MSLRYQINLRILLCLSLIVLVAGPITLWQARESVSREVASSVNLAAQLIKLNFTPLQPGRVDIDHWLPNFISLEQTRHLKIQLKKPDGQVVKFTSGRKAGQPNPPPQWFVSWVSAAYPAMEQALITTDGSTLTLSISADPFDEVCEAWRESQDFFGTLALMAMLILTAVNLLFNTTLKSINIIVQGLEAIEQGDYQHKLPDFATSEYQSIAKAINHMTAVLHSANRENRALASHSLEIQEDERKRLSQELHDDLGQSLTAIKVMAVALKQNPADNTKIPDTIVEICDHLIGVVRSMMRNLHPLVLTELGLKATLEDLVHYWAARQPGLRVMLECQDNVDELENKTAIQLFRMVQEGITNIVRHAQANQAVITLTVSRSGRQKVLKLIISDNGQGCPPDRLKAGFGLLGLRERVKSMGGDFKINSQPGAGLSISAEIPVS